jgi:hypothetical protein
VGEIAMVSFDTTALPDAQVMLVAQAPRPAESSKERVLGVCMPVGYIAPVDPNGEENGFVPTNTAVSYFKRYEKQTFVESEYPDPIKDVKVTRQPTHGRVTAKPLPGNNEVDWLYLPDVGYEGPDRVDFVVQVKDQPVRLVYYIQVTKKNLDTTPGEVFCKKSLWKISLPTSGATGHRPQFTEGSFRYKLMAN